MRRDRQTDIQTTKKKSVAVLYLDERLDDAGVPTRYNGVISCCLSTSFARFIFYLWISYFYTNYESPFTSAHPPTGTTSTRFLLLFFVYRIVSPYPLKKTKLPQRKQPTTNHHYHKYPSPHRSPSLASPCSRPTCYNSHTFPPLPQIPTTPNFTPPVTTRPDPLASIFDYWNVRLRT